FLDHAPVFSFTAIDLPPKATELFFAYLDASLLKNCLREKLPGDHPSRVRKIVKNKKARGKYQEKKLVCVQEALAETFESTLGFEQHRMNWLVGLSVEQIAMSVSAWKNGVDLSSLKRHGPAAYRKVTRVGPYYRTLSLIMEADRPAFQAFRDNLLRLQK